MKALLFLLSTVVSLSTVSKVFADDDNSFWNSKVNSSNRSLSCYFVKVLEVDSDSQKRTAQILDEKEIDLGMPTLLSPNTSGSNHQIVLEAKSAQMKATITCERCWCDSVMPISGYGRSINPNTTGLTIRIEDTAGRGTVQRRFSRYTLADGSDSLFGQVIAYGAHRSGDSHVAGSFEVFCEPVNERPEEFIPCGGIRSGANSAIKEAQRKGVIR